MPTLGGPSAGPELAERSKQGDEALAAAQAEFESLWPTMVLMAATIAQRAEENFPSTAYGPYLKERGADPVWAQSLGSLAISLGTRRSNRSRQIGTVVEALRFLAQGKRQRGLNGTELSELVYLLKGGVNGEPLERDRIREMAAAVVSSFPSARGRKVSTASAAHEEFLKFARIVGPHGYTYSNDEEDFVDERTKATRFEFDDPDFDPRPAYQRFSAGRRAKAS